MAVHSLSPSATRALLNVHCLNIFLFFVFYIEIQISESPENLGDLAAQRMRCYVVTTGWAATVHGRRGWSLQHATLLSTAYRPGLSLRPSFTSTPGTYGYMTPGSCCKFYKSTWRLLSEWLQKCIFLSLSLCRINTYCWGGGKLIYMILLFNALLQQ